MNGWKEDKESADIYIPEVKRILGEHLIFEGTTRQDQMENTDLIVLTASQIRIGVRIRNPGYFEKYGDQLTIRSGRPGGTKTELEKIIDGWGDYFFYGHGDGQRLIAWGIGKLDALRKHILCERLCVDTGYPRSKKQNHDGSSSFVYLRWSDIHQFIVAQQGLVV